jgi:hypothetical protein
MGARAFDIYLAVAARAPPPRPQLRVARGNSAAAPRLLTYYWRLSILSHTCDVCVEDDAAWRAWTWLARRQGYPGHALLAR